MTPQIAQVAREHAKGRIVSYLGGGYSLSAPVVVPLQESIPDPTAIRAIFLMLLHSAACCPSSGQRSHQVQAILPERQTVHVMSPALR
jgi:hypothetical protein